MTMHVNQKKIQGPQSHDGKNIRSKHNKWIVSNGKDGGNTIHGKNQVSNFNKN